jgi:hypothetical protein
MPDRGLFGVAALGGFGAICGLKLYGYNPDLIAVLSVGIMITYGVVAFYMPRVQMRLDRLGDNFYYLGFIYTLASLSVALLQLRGAGAQIEQLLGSFGIALATTIVGIAGRVLFVQLRSEIDEVEERTRRDLAAASADLREQVASSVREFETLRTAFIQTLSETTNECLKAGSRQISEIDALTKRAAEQISSTFEANRLQSEKQNQAMETVAKAIERASQAAFEANRLQCEQVNQSANNVAQIVDQAGQRVAALALPSDRLNSQLVAFAQELEAILKRLGGIIEDISVRAGVRRRRWFGRSGESKKNISVESENNP